MTSSRNEKTLLDGPLDRAADAEYAAVSTAAIVGLILAVAGVAAFWAPSLMTAWPVTCAFTAVPLVGAVLSAAALRRIRRSQGVLTGGRIAAAGIVVGAAGTLGAAAFHVLTYVDDQHTLTLLESRSMEVIDELAAGRYEQVYETVPPEFRSYAAASAAPSAEMFRSHLEPLFKGAGAPVSCTLLTLRIIPEDDHRIAPAEWHVELEHRALNVTVGFLLAPSGRWELVGVGGEETLASQLKSPSGPAPVAGPFETGEEHEHHH
jgi:hypothetical protein